MFVVFFSLMAYLFENKIWYLTSAARIFHKSKVLCNNHNIHDNIDFCQKMVSNLFHRKTYSLAELRFNTTRRDVDVATFISPEERMYNQRNQVQIVITYNSKEDNSKCVSYQKTTKAKKQLVSCSTQYDIIRSTQKISIPISSSLSS